MSSVDSKKSVVERDDPLAVETLRIIGSLREAQPILADFLKASQKYTQACAAAVASSGAMLDALSKLADHQGADLGEGVRHLFETQKALEEHKHRVVQAWNDQVQGELATRLPNDKNEVATWEKNYKAKRVNSVKLIKKAEAVQQKCNKPKARAKAPDKADESDRQLEQASADHDRLLREELRDVVRLERKKHCRFIQQMGFLLDTQASMAQADLDAICTCREQLGNLAESEDLITGKARILLNDEGSSPPPFVSSSGAAAGDGGGGGGMAIKGSASSSISLSPSQSNIGGQPDVNSHPSYDPLKSPLLNSGHGADLELSSSSFQPTTATIVDYSVQSPHDSGHFESSDAPLDDLLQDDLWQLVNGGGPVSTFYSNQAPGDVDIAAALRDIDALATNL
jgi:hypothetical protein